MPSPMYVSEDEVNPKTRLGQVKPSISAVPQSAILHLSMAMMDGVTKYGIYNWREKDVPARIYADAAYRHLAAWIDGEACARDSKKSHLAHIMACCAILIDAEEHGCLIDDRGPPGPAADVIEKLSQQLADELEEFHKKQEQMQRKVPRRTPEFYDEVHNRVKEPNDG